MLQANFGELVLGCINADVGNQILMSQHFSRSTRFAILLHRLKLKRFREVCQHVVCKAAQEVSWRSSFWNQLSAQAALKKMKAEKRKIGKKAQSDNAKKNAIAMKKAGKGIFAPKKLSDALAAICGKKTAPRTEVGPA